jgi:hypothetical protein
MFGHTAAMAWVKKDCPALVKRILRPNGSINGTPKESSNWRICIDTAGCVTDKRSAALETEFWRATSRKVWICFKV